MSLTTDAAAVAATFPDATVDTPQGPLPLRAVLLAIGGAESGWHDEAAGDYGFDPSYGLCDGWSSWGWLQVHNVHAAYLERVTGSSDPCQWAAWLYDPLHCAQAALAIVGPTPTQQQLADTWTTFAGGEWTAHLAAAEGALSGGGGTGGGTGGTTTGSVNAIPLGTLALAAAGIAAVLALAGGAVEVEESR